MILYYAVGGGLGHISRSLAILNRSQWLAGRTRLMTSSAIAGLTVNHSPSPVDHVAEETIRSKRRYSEFLSDYLERYRVRLLIVDTFPSGIVGEWGWVKPSIPVMLVARHLKWKEYSERAGAYGVAPAHTLMVEPLDQEQERALENCGDVLRMDSPITLEQPQGRAVKSGVLVVHSGPAQELAELKKIATERVGGADSIDIVSPERGVYPAESFIRDYSTIVSGAGYNMCALASQAAKGVTHILHPFERRYDDQFLRARRIRDGMWSGAVGDGAQKAATWLQELAAGYLR
ncbi:MAG: hypothetical protein HQK86_14650 [Nitrospinae bacterium]|nr:hypothetical protein [Nitrospinota bacterium]MBF0633441.1 hypothetical protein [Nitrospinota bacterium]